MDTQHIDPLLTRPPVVLPAPLPAFQLARHILIDFEAYEYVVHSKIIRMTLRENQLLLPLVKKYQTSPRGFLPARMLVEWINPNWMDSLDPEQGVAQVASDIRRKWGEACRSPRFLICIRDIGYQLRPEPGFGIEVIRVINDPNLSET